MRAFMKGMVMVLTLVPALLSCNAVQAAREATDDQSMIDDPRVQHRSYIFAPTGETPPRP